MAVAKSTGSAPTTTTQWNEDVIFSVLGEPARRRLLMTLARGGPRSASELHTAKGKYYDAVLKQLAVLRAAGLVTTKLDPADGRRTLYSLSPAVQFKDTEDGRVMYFRFCTLLMD